LDGLEQDYRATDNPLLLGLVHEALALVALAGANGRSCDSQLELADAYYRQTGNPVLIAQAKRVADAAARAERAAVERPGGDGKADEDDAEGAARASGSFTLAELGSAPDRHDYALSLVIQRSGARAGCLYLFEDGGLRLAAACGFEASPEPLERALREQLEISELTLRTQNQSTLLDLGGSDSQSTLFSSSPPPFTDGAYQVVVLRVQRDGVVIVVGGMILDPGVHGRNALDAAFVQAVADALVDPID
jgi:hypothetical protein